MALTLNATIGATTANSYETIAEAQDYWDSRLFTDNWENSDDQAAALVWSTRVLDSMAVPHRVLREGKNGTWYYRTSPQWEGTPATITQRLAWPRIGLLDRNGNPLDWSISSISIAVATVVTTTLPHRRTTGETVLIFGSDSTPSIDGPQVITVLSATTFSIPVTVTIAGTKGGVAIIPQELKDAVSELAGQLSLADRTLDSDVAVQGVTSVRAGSVSVSFRENVEAQVLPDVIWALMPDSWFTDELIEPAWPAQFDVL